MTTGLGKYIGTRWVWTRNRGVQISWFHVVMVGWALLALRARVRRERENFDAILVGVVGVERKDLVGGIV